MLTTFASFKLVGAMNTSHVQIVKNLVHLDKIPEATQWPGLIKGQQQFLIAFVQAELSDLDLFG